MVGEESYFKNLSLCRLANRIQSALLLSNGTVYTFGGDEPCYDQVKEMRKIAFPKLLSFPRKIIQVCVGNSHSLFLTSENSVYGIGSNQFGQLGLPPSILQLTNTPLELDISELQKKEIIQIQTGIAGGTNILTRDGIVYTAGEFCGRDCTPESPNSKILPIPSEHFQNEHINYLSEGGCVKFFVTSSGAVYVIGANSNAEANGILGLGPTPQHFCHIPTRLDSLWERNIRISKGSAGRFHSIVIDSHGHLYGWGGNRNGALGLSAPDIDSPTRIPIFKPNSNVLEVFQSVSCSWYHSLALTNEGKVYAFGSNHFGQLGIPQQSESAAPTLVNIHEPVLHICAGGSHSLFVMSSHGSSDILGNEFRTCGLSRHNQLGSQEELRPILQCQGRDYQDCRLQPTSENQDVLQLCILNDYEITISYEEKKKKTRQLQRSEKKRKEPPVPETEEEASPPDEPFPEPILDDSSFESIVCHYQLICQRQVEVWYHEQVQMAEERSDDTTLDSLENGQMSRERYEKSLGNTLWDYFNKRYTSDQFPNEYEHSLEAILSAVRGFSDFREVYADVFQYLVRGIQQMSLAIAVKAVEVCNLLYSTVEVDTFYHSDWVEIVLQRSLESLSQTHQSFHESKDHDHLDLQTFETILTHILQMIEFVYQSGNKYQNELKSSATTKSLSDLLSDLLLSDPLLHSLELSHVSTSTSTSIEWPMASSSTKVTIENIIYRLLSLCSENLHQKMNHLNQIKVSISGHSPVAAGAGGGAAAGGGAGGGAAAGAAAVASTSASDSIQSHYFEIFQQLNYKMITNSLLDGYNSMCEETDDDLQLHVEAVSNHLSLSAMSVLYHVTEGSDNNTEVLMEAIMWFSLLLQYWNENSVEQMRIKREIAKTLKDFGIIEAVMRHMEFWAIEWNGCYGDCSFGIFKCLRYLTFYFPEVMKLRLQQCDQRVVAMISSASQQCGNTSEDARVILNFIQN